MKLKPTYEELRERGESAICNCGALSDPRMTRPVPHALNCATLDWHLLARVREALRAVRDEAVAARTEEIADAFDHAGLLPNRDPGGVARKIRERWGK